MENPIRAGCSKKHGKRRSENLPLSVQTVISNNDLLTLILLRLPVLSLILFKSVSKRWLSLIKQVNDVFRQLDSPCGMFLKFHPLESYEFVPSDIRIPFYIHPLLEHTFTFGPLAPRWNNQNVEILHSCNGLLLCRLLRGEIYVYNPSISNMFKVIPYPDYPLVKVCEYPHTDCLRLHFDPAKSPHYKVIYGKLVRAFHLCITILVHTYSSKPAIGVIFINSFHLLILFSLVLRMKFIGMMLLKLDISNELLDITTLLPTPLTLDGKVHSECRLFESRDCLLFVGKDDAHSRHFTVYEKGGVCSEWSVKYIVNLGNIVKPFPKRWSVHTVFLGEREEDSFVVLILEKKVVQYKIMSKTFCTITNLGSREDLAQCFPLIPSFANL